MPGQVPTHITVDLPVQSENVLPVANAPVATNDVAGVVIPDSITIRVDPITGLLSAIAGAGLPTQTGHAGQLLTTDGAVASWTPNIDCGSF